MRSICVLSREDAKAFMLGKKIPSCRTHRHLTRQEAFRLNKQEQVAWVGPKQVVSSVEKVTCIESDYSVTQISAYEADYLCETGHARWKRTNVIEIIRNIHGPGLSLKVGGGFAYAACMKEGEWARVGISDIFR